MFSGRFLSGFSILSLVLYFVTSSDSGSLVIDCLASNGHPEPPRLQRLLWALLGNNTNRAANDPSVFTITEKDPTIGSSFVESAY